MNGNSLFAMPSGSSTRSHPHSSNSRPESLVPVGRRFTNDDSANLWSPCSNCSSSDENNSPTALNSINWDKPALEDKSVNFGWNSTQDRRASHKSSDRRTKQNQEKKPSGYVNLRSGETKNLASLTRPSPKKERQTKDTPGDVTDTGTTSHSEEDRLRDAETDDHPDSTSESYESMRSEEEIQKEREDLRNVAWFQAGIPREIALEVLAEKPEGSFIVRESTTKPGCYALSLRVPPGKNQTGIAHYLILQTNKGYKIKGFTKEFSSLNALITHHSVMPELLPCPLSLARHSTRDAEHEFEETEIKTCDIFADIHWLMTDLEI